jgi:hypothetical protein
MSTTDADLEPSGLKDKLTFGWIFKELPGGEPSGLMVPLV